MERPQASPDQMKESRVPLGYRDACGAYSGRRRMLTRRAAGMLIPLNECRRETWWAPWKCTEERHAYEHCQYDEYMKRVEAMNALRKEPKKP